MGTRCSAILTAQVPLEQQRRGGGGTGAAPSASSCGLSGGLWSPPSPPPGQCVGISLGTTHSCVAVWMNDRVQTVWNDRGGHTTPSCVAFTESDRLIGEAAVSQAATNASNTIFGASRLVGRKFSDPVVQSGMKRLPFAVVPGPGNALAIEVMHKGERKLFKAEEISAMVFGEMRDFAEAYLCKEVKNAVISVPAHFNDSQRQATKEAASIAGLNVLRVINEPTAAAIAIGLDKTADEKNVLVFDLGGSTLDVSVLVIEEGIFEVKATSEDPHLGGDDFDERLVHHFVRKIEREHRVDLSGDAGALHRLRLACERAKRMLSRSGHATAEVESLVPNHPPPHSDHGERVDFREIVTRAEFEDMCAGLFRRVMVCVEGALRDADLEKEEIDEVVVVGGSSRIPKVRRMLSDFFVDGKKMHLFNEPFNEPDEAAAHGATVQAAILSGADKSETLTELLLLDVTTLSYGVAVEYDNALPTPADANDAVSGAKPFQDATLLRVVKRNTTVPAKKTIVLTTSEDNQSHVAIAVFMGECPQTEHNIFLGSVTFGPLPPMPRGFPQIKATIDVEASGFLRVSASCHLMGTRTEKSVVFSPEVGRFTQEDLERMVSESERSSAADARVVAAREETSALRAFVSSMRGALEASRVRRSLGEGRCAVARAALDEAEGFLSLGIGNGAALAAEDAADALRARREQLESLLGDVCAAAEAGEANAARVSRGTRHDVWAGLTVKDLRRAAQHCTVTITMYNAVRGGVPSAADVCAAIDDLERLYDACDWCGRLSDGCNGAGIGQAKKVQARRALLALAMATHPRLGADSPAKCLPRELLLMQIGSFLVPQLGKLQELTPETMETMRKSILGTSGVMTWSEEDAWPDVGALDLPDIEEID